jgi:hypothetical protein
MPRSKIRPEGGDMNIFIVFVSPSSQFLIFITSYVGVRLSAFGTSATNWPVVQSRIINEYVVYGGMRMGRGSRSIRRKPAPMPLCPPQFPNDLGSNSGLRGGKPPTNRLSFGTASAYFPVHCPHSPSFGDAWPERSLNKLRINTNFRHLYFRSRIVVCACVTLNFHGSTRYSHI